MLRRCEAERGGWSGGREVDGKPNGVNPMGMVLKGLDLRRAELITGIRLQDQATLSAAHTALVDKGLPGIKCRASVNASAKRVNRKMLVPPMSYASIQDALQLVQCGWTMVKGDVANYFNNFLIARESYELHTEACERCREAGKISEDCYFSILRLCLRLLKLSWR
jgi:hypothetical protein